MFPWPDLPHSQEIFAGTLEFISSLKPDLLVHTGDITSSGREEELGRAKEILSRYPHRQAVLVGDHDYRPPTRDGCFRFFPQRNQALTIGRWKIILLSVFPSADDLLWLRGELERPQEMPKLVFTHRLVVCNPLVARMAKKTMHVDLLSPEAEVLRGMVNGQNGVKAVLSGHIHRNSTRKENGVAFITTSSLADRPHQFRILELRRGYVAVRLYTARTHREVRDGRWERGRTTRVEMRL